MLMGESSERTEENSNKEGFGSIHAREISITTVHMSCDIGIIIKIQCKIRLLNAAYANIMIQIYNSPTRNSDPLFLACWFKDAESSLRLS